MSRAFPPAANHSLLRFGRGSGLRSRNQSRGAGSNSGLLAANYLLTAGTLEGPSAEELVRMALEEPPRPLVPDLDTLLHLCSEVEDVPELAGPLAATLGSRSPSPQLGEDALGLGSSVRRVRRHGRD